MQDLTVTQYANQVEGILQTARLIELSRFSGRKSNAQLSYFKKEVLIDFVNAVKEEQVIFTIHNTYYQIASEAQKAGRLSYADFTLVQNSFNEATKNYNTGRRALKQYKNYISGYFKRSILATEYTAQLISSIEAILAF